MQLYSPLNTSYKYRITEISLPCPGLEGGQDCLFHTGIGEPLPEHSGLRELGRETVVNIRSTCSKICGG